MAQATKPVRLGRLVASLGVPPDELVGVAEVAQMFSVSKQTAIKYGQRPDFPEPLDRLASGPVWRRIDVDQWGREHLPLPTGRPRRAAVITFGISGGVPPVWISLDEAGTLAGWLQDWGFQRKAEGLQRKAEAAQELGGRIDDAAHDALRTAEDARAHVDLAHAERKLLVDVLREQPSEEVRAGLARLFDQLGG